VRHFFYLEIAVNFFTIRCSKLCSVQLYGYMVKQTRKSFVRLSQHETSMTVGGFLGSDIEPLFISVSSNRQAGGPNKLINLKTPSRDFDHFAICFISTSILFIYHFRSFVLRTMNNINLPKQICLQEVMLMFYSNIWLVHECYVPSLLYSDRFFQSW